MHGPETKGKMMMKKRGMKSNMDNYNNFHYSARNLVLISRNASNIIFILALLHSLKLQFLLLLVHFLGTSISFGFKKKTYSATNKKQLNIVNNNNVNINREKDEKSTIISNLNVIKAEQNNFVITGDDNGNSTNTGD